MKRIQNTVVLAELWAKATGIPVAEANMRVRALRLAGLLPDCRSSTGHRPLTPDEVATFIIAAMGSDTHLHAPQVAKKYARLCPLPGSEIGNDLARAVGRMTLTDALATILQRARDGAPQMAVTLTISASHTEASLVIDDDVLIYGSSPDDAEGEPWPLQRDVTLAGPVLGRMAGVLAMSPERAAHIIAEYERKAAA